MKVNLFLSLVIILLFSNQVSEAHQLSSGNPDEFNRIAYSIVAQNPLLQSYMLENESELENLKSDNNLSDPEIEGRHLWGPKSEGNKWGFSVTQSFDWPGAYVARRRANALAANAIEVLHLVNYYDKLGEIKSALINLIGVRKRIALAREIFINIDSVNSLIKDGFIKGETTRLDVNKVAIERINAQRNLSDALIEQENILSQIKSLNGNEMPDLKDLNEYPMIVMKSQEEYLKISQEKNPQLAYLKASENQAIAREKVEKLSMLPSFSVGYELENEEGNFFNGFSVGMTLPFFSRRHKRKAAELATNSISLKTNVAIIEEETRIESEYSAASRMMKELQDYAPYVDNVDNISLLRKAYIGGQINLIEYLTELSYFSQARMDFLLLQQNCWQTLISLDRYQAVIIENNN